MERPIEFKIEKKNPDSLARVGILKTPHGEILTPAFCSVGTKATVKSLTPEQILGAKSQVMLSNTYHLYLEPGHKTIEEAGGLNKFSGWNGPTYTDSGGFQAFSLGRAFGKGISKIAKGEEDKNPKKEIDPIAYVTEEGVNFKSHIDGSMHFFTPEKSIEIQHSIGADIIFVFDECTSPQETYKYQKEALKRTHRWAKQCLSFHKSKENSKHQGLFGIVQGGQFEDLRKESAVFLAGEDFDGFGIGGSFNKEDISKSVKMVCEILPEEKPRHLLGIGAVLDIFSGVEAGCDTFDCVAPTREARNGTLYTKKGKINILNFEFRKDLNSLDENCECYTCKNFSKSYVAHLFRAKEILANTLATIHNLYFINKLFEDIRKSILEGNYEEFKKRFLKGYLK